MPEITSQPNYKKMLRDRINAVKYAYSEYRKAMKEYLDHSWISDDGALDFYKSYDIIVKEELAKYEKAKKDLEEFKIFIKVQESLDKEKTNG